MKFLTKELGEIEYFPENIITFEEGIPGFEDAKEFVFIMSEDADLPFHHLQSVEFGDICFIVTNPFLFVEDYDFDLPNDVVSKLGIKTTEELYVYSIVTIPKKVEFTTVNLAAPIIVNTTTKLGKQVILEQRDDVRHLLFKKEG